MSFPVTGVSLLQAFFSQTENKSPLLDAVPCKGLSSCLAPQQVANSCQGVFWTSEQSQTPDGHKREHVLHRAGRFSTLNTMYFNQNKNRMQTPISYNSAMYSRSGH